MSRHHPHLWMARLLRLASDFCLYSYIPCIPSCNDWVMIYDNFMIISGFFWLLYGYLNFNWFGIAKCQAFRFFWPSCWRRTLDCRENELNMAHKWQTDVAWVGWGLVFCFNLALGLWVFVWFRNWCHVDTSWKRCSEQSCTFRRMCLYLESISIPYQVLEFYIQKIVDTVSGVTQQLRYQYHLNWSKVYIYI